MIDVSTLSVSIEVDMSAFVEAMEDVAAMLIATAEMFEDVAQDISDSLQGINTSGGETKGVFAQVVEFILKAIEIFKALKDIISAITWIFTELGIAEEGATATSLLASFLELIGVSAELATPIGWVLLALT